MSLSGFKDFSQMVTAPVGRKEVNISVGLLDMDLLCRAITFECNRGGQVRGGRVGESLGTWDVGILCER